VFFWVSDFSKKADAKEQATCLIYDALNKEKISISYPAHTALMKKFE